MDIIREIELLESTEEIDRHHSPSSLLFQRQLTGNGGAAKDSLSIANSPAYDIRHRVQDSHMTRRLPQNPLFEPVFDEDVLPVSVFSRKYPPSFAPTSIIDLEEMEIEAEPESSSVGSSIRSSAHYSFVPNFPVINVKPPASIAKPPAPSESHDSPSRGADFQPPDWLDDWNYENGNPSRAPPPASAPAPAHMPAVDTRPVEKKVPLHSSSHLDVPPRSPMLPMGLILRTYTQPANNDVLDNGTFASHQTDRSVSHDGAPILYHPHRPPSHVVAEREHASKGARERRREERRQQRQAVRAMDESEMADHVSRASASSHGNASSVVASVNIPSHRYERPASSRALGAGDRATDGLIGRPPHPLQDAHGTEGGPRRPPLSSHYMYGGAHMYGFGHGHAMGAGSGWVTRGPASVTMDTAGATFVPAMSHRSLHDLADAATADAGRTTTPTTAAGAVPALRKLHSVTSSSDAASASSRSTSPPVSPDAPAPQVLAHVQVELASVHAPSISIARDSPDTRARHGRHIAPAVDMQPRPSRGVNHEYTQAAAAAGLAGGPAAPYGLGFASGQRLSQHAPHTHAHAQYYSPADSHGAMRPSSRSGPQRALSMLSAPQRHPAPSSSPVTPAAHAVTSALSPSSLPTTTALPPSESSASAPASHAAAAASTVPTHAVPASSSATTSSKPTTTHAASAVPPTTAASASGSLSDDLRSTLRRISLHEGSASPHQPPSSSTVPATTSFPTAAYSPVHHGAKPSTQALPATRPQQQQPHLQPSAHAQAQAPPPSLQEPTRMHTRIVGASQQQHPHYLTHTVPVAMPVPTPSTARRASPAPAPRPRSATHAPPTSSAAPPAGTHPSPYVNTYAHPYAMHASPDAYPHMHAHPHGLPTSVSSRARSGSASSPVVAQVPAHAAQSHPSSLPARGSFVSHDSSPSSADASCAPTGSAPVCTVPPAASFSDASALLSSVVSMLSPQAQAELVTLLAQGLVQGAGSPHVQTLSPAATSLLANSLGMAASGLHRQRSVDAADANAATNAAAYAPPPLSAPVASPHAHISFTQPPPAAAGEEVGSFYAPEARIHAHAQQQPVQTPTRMPTQLQRSPSVPLSTHPHAHSRAHAYAHAQGHVAAHVAPQTYAPAPHMLRGCSSTANSHYPHMHSHPHHPSAHALPPSGAVAVRGYSSATNHASNGPASVPVPTTTTTILAPRHGDVNYGDASSAGAYRPAHAPAHALAREGDATGAAQPSMDGRGLVPVENADHSPSAAQRQLEQRQLEARLQKYVSSPAHAHAHLSKGGALP